MIRAVRAALRAGRGDLSGSTEDSRGALRVIAGPTPPPMLEMLARIARGLALMAGGDPDGAITEFRRVAHVERHYGYCNPIAVSSRPDLCEALIAMGDLDGAGKELTVLSEQARTSAQVWAQAMVHRLEGLLLDARSGLRSAGVRSPGARSPGIDGQAIDRHFAAALAGRPDGFDAACARLAWAESLVRRGCADQAAPLLTDAAVELTRLGARPWEQRARRALAAAANAGAAGRPVPVSVPAAFTTLTGKELGVAIAIAEGLRNREAAERLFMSPKTVEHHLSRIYANLAVRSRTELTRLAAHSGVGAPEIALARPPRDGPGL